MFALSRWLVVVFIGGTVFCSATQAQTIQYTFGGNVDVEIDGTVNSGVDFQLVATANTDNIDTSFGGGLIFVNNDAVTIDFGALGLFDVTEATSTFVNQNTNVLGFAEENVGFGKFDLGSDSAFSSFDLATELPAVELSATSNGQGIAVTDGATTGEIEFTSFLSPVSFTSSASAVPEPSSMCWIGLIATGGLMRRRR
jgi:uncharacterized protein (TIGR03382 family)